MTDLAALSGAFADLPRELLPELSLSRSAVRTDGALVVFNWVDPPTTLPLTTIRSTSGPDPRGPVRHAGGRGGHPLGPGEFVYIPAGASHGLEAVGSEPVLNVDVFSPAREDYLHLVEEQARG